MRYLSRYGVVLTAFFSACSTSPPKIQLRLRADTGTKSITISGLDPAIAGEIARDSSQDEWRALIPVFKMPKDTDLKDYQYPQPGAYRVNDTAIVFTPDTPFIHGQTYFLRYYDPGQGKSTMDIIRSGRKLDSKVYTDLTFTK